MKDAEKGKQEGIQGQWQRESPAKEYLEQVKCCTDTDCAPKMMKYRNFALRSGDWEEYTSIFKVEVKPTEGAFERIREASEKVAKDEAGRLSSVQGIVLKRHRFPAAYHRASRRTRRCHDVVLVPELQQLSPGRLRVVVLGRSTAAGGAQVVVIGEGTGCWWCNRRQCQSGQGFQSACGTARSV